MTTHPITGSSQIAELAYDEKQAKMYVTFHTGAIYVYMDVPQEVFVQVLSAPSVGSAFTQIIKKGGYAYQKV